jgi:hypothetical protein
MTWQAPRPVADVLVSALPQLSDRLLEARLRRSWVALVGPDTARRSQPQSLVSGCLTVVVDNSPWLHELTLRAAELTARLHAEYPAVQSLRLTLGRLDREAPERAEREAAPSVELSETDDREIDAAAAAIADPALASAARRLLSRAWRSARARGVTR